MAATASFRATITRSSRPASKMGVIVVQKAAVATPLDVHRHAGVCPGEAQAPNPLKVSLKFSLPSKYSTRLANGLTAAAVCEF